MPLILAGSHGWAQELRDDFNWQSSGVLADGAGETIRRSASTGWGWGGYAAGSDIRATSGNTLSLPSDPGNYVYTIFSTNGDGVPTHSVDLSGVGAAVRLMYPTAVANTTLRWLVRDAGGKWHISSTTPGRDLRLGYPARGRPMSWGVAWYTWNAIGDARQTDMNQMDNGGSLNMNILDPSTPDLSTITGLGMVVDASSSSVSLDLSWLVTDDYLELMPFDPAWGSHVMELRDGKYYMDYNMWGGASLGAFRIDGGPNLQAPGHGRSWQGATRSTLHGGKFNPTQAGTDEPIGAVTEMWYAPSSTDPSLTRIEYGPFQLPNWGDQHYTSQYGDLASRGTGLYPNDDDGLPEVGMSQRDEVMSEFFCSGWQEDVSNLISDPNTGAMRSYQQFDYSMEPYNCILQFNETNGHFKPDHVLADISPLLPGAQPSTQLTPTKNLHFWGFRLDRNNASYNYVWYPRVAGGHEVFHFDKIKDWKRPTDRGEVWHMILAESGSDMNAPAIMLYYPPWSDFNKKNIAGIDATTGEIVYEENRKTGGGSSGYCPDWRASWRAGAPGTALRDYRDFYSDGEPGSSHFNKADFSIANDGMLNPGYGIPGTYERIRYEWFMIFGTVQTVLDAKDELDAHFLAQQKNAAPVFAPESMSMTLLYGTSLNTNISAQVSDADGDEVTFFKVTGAEWVSVSSNGVLSGTPTHSDIGTSEVMISVSDGELLDSMLIKIEVDRGNEVNLFADGFESGDFTTGGWNLSGTPEIDPDHANEGVYNAEINQNDVLSNTVSTEGMKDIKLSYARRCNTTVQAGEYLSVEWSPDGVSWNSLEQTAETAYALKTWDLPAGAEDQPGFQFRFSMNADAINEWAWIDDVSVDAVLARASMTYVVAEGNFENPLEFNGTWGKCPAVWNDTGSGPFEVSGDHFTTTADGSLAANMGGVGTIYQEVGPVNAGDTLSVVFYGGRAKADTTTDEGGVFNCTFKVGSSTNTVSVDTTGLANDSWQAYTNSWVATESGTLTLEFSNVSGKPWLDNISDVTVLTPAPLNPPEVTFQMDGTEASFTIETVAGIEYRLVYKNELTSTNGWIPVVPPNPNGWMKAIGESIMISDPEAADHTQRFYRIEARMPSAE